MSVQFSLACIKHKVAFKYQREFVLSRNSEQGPSIILLANFLCFLRFSGMRWMTFVFHYKSMFKSNMCKNKTNYIRFHFFLRCLFFKARRWDRLPSFRYVATALVYKFIIYLFIVICQKIKLRYQQMSSPFFHFFNDFCSIGTQTPCQCQGCTVEGLHII